MRELTFDLDGLRVFIAIPAGRPAEWDTVTAFLTTVFELANRGIYVKPGLVKGSCYVTQARNELLEMFLRSDCNRLFWIDSDMDWKPDDVIRLLALSTKVDIVAAPYVFKRDDETRFTIKAEDGQYPVSELGLIEVLACGTGFVCQTRESVEAICKVNPRVTDAVSKREMPYVFTTDVTPDGNFRGEDIKYFDDLRTLGYPCWIDPWMKVRHLGLKAYSARLADHIGLTEAAESELEVAAA